MTLSLSHRYPGSGVVLDCIDSNFCPLSYFDSLSSLSDPESQVPDNIAPSPTVASPPLVQDQTESRAKTAKAVLNHPLRIMIENCQSIKNKKADFQIIIDSAKPDIILGNESWLTPDIKNSEIYPESFDLVQSK